jgi:hypothetical protein
MHALLLCHVVVSLGYYWYTQANVSDSVMYYTSAARLRYGDGWFDYYGFPFANYLGLTYESTMVVFSMIGFVGFLYFYTFLVEQVQARVELLGMDGRYLLLFLPNTHFWTASLGKGSVIFVGIMMVFWSMNDFRRRYLHFLIGAAVVYHVRPQILMIILIAIAVGLLMSNRVALRYRIAALAVCGPLVLSIYGDLLETFRIDNEERTLEAFLERRAESLSEAGSGIDISNYSLPEKVFAFMFRPLFVDTDGVFGMVASFENVICLLIVAPVLARGFLPFLIRAAPLVKIASLTFLLGTFALSQITGNLGIGLRQRSQVMLLGLFVVLKFQEQCTVRRAEARAVRLRVRPVFQRV